MYTVYIGLFVLGVAAGYLWRRAIAHCEAAQGANWGGKWLNRLDGLNRLICHRFPRLQHDPIRLPATGPALLVANHVSGLDPLLMIAASPRPLRFIIAREEYQRFGFAWLFRAIGCIPIERSANPRRALKATVEALARGEVVALFPHGRIHLDRNGPGTLKRGIVYLAKTSGAPVYPLRIDGVRGEGRTIIAVTMRSRARIRVFKRLHYADEAPEQLLETLAKLLGNDEFTTDAGLKNPGRAPE